MKGERASITVSLIVVLILLGSLSQWITSDLLSTYQLSQHKEHTPKLRLKLFEQLITPSAGAHSKTQKLTQGGKTLSGTIQYHIPAPSTKLYKLNSLLSVSESCPPLSQKNEAPIPSPFSITRFSPVSSRRCEFNTLSLKGVFRTHFNLRGNLIAQKQGALSVFTNGYFAISHSIEVEDDLLLLAGGDIYIESLRVYDPNSRIAVISLNGGIEIKNVHGTTQLYLDPFSNLSVPSNLTLTNTTPLIEESKGWISSLFLGSL